MTGEFDNPRLRKMDPTNERTILRRFELTAALSTRGGSAAAKLLAWDGSDVAKVDRETFTVYDSLACYKAPSGMQGWAKFVADAKQWEIVRLANFDRIEGQATAAVTGGSTFNIDNIKVRHGADPRSDTSSTTETVTVYNRFSEYCDDNAVCFAEWNEEEQQWEAYFLDSTCPTA